MKANELRRGNLVQDSAGIHEVESIFASGIHNKQFNGYPYEFIKGILLTEEWLFNLGFEKLETEGVFYIHGEELSIKISEDLTEVAHRNWRLKGVNIEHVHQLQNLFFSLTGQELNITKQHNS